MTEQSPDVPFEVKRLDAEQEYGTLLEQALKTHATNLRTEANKLESELERIRNVRDLRIMGLAATGGIRLVDSGRYNGLEFFEFDCGNGYGASVTRRKSADGLETYGGNDGKWELWPLVLRSGKQTITMSEEMGAELLGWDDPKGWLSPDDVSPLLATIAALPAR